MALAQETARLNSVAAGLSAESLWKLGKHESNLFGTALENAFSYVKIAGDKAVDGTKLCPEVRQVYLGMTGKWLGNKKEPSPCKVEPGLSVKAEATQPMKEEPGTVKGVPVGKG